MKPRLLALTVFLAAAASAQDGMPPHLREAGHTAYEAYLRAHDHRAFAIAPGGAWGWAGDAATPGDAEEDALAACRENTEQTCVLYAVDGRKVWDAGKWTRLWAPYADARAASAARIGNHRGERFPNLVFADAEGRSHSVAELRGKVAVLHFWGSWCGPCRREMPSLETLHNRLRDRADVAFVLMQAREDIRASRQWASAQELHLPLYDSGATGRTDAWLRTADGARIADREIAMTFPTTYVLDKRGVVIFSHVGPAPDWGQYREFLLDAALRSGR